MLQSWRAPSLGLVVVAAGCVFAPAAAAQGITGAVTGRVSYSSNLSGGTDELAELKQVKQEDVLYSLGLMGAYRRSVSRSDYFANASVNLTRYATNTNLGSEDIQVGVGGSTRLGGCAINGTATYARNQSLPEELLVVVDRNINVSKTLGAQASCGFGQVVASVSGSFVRSDNSADEVGFVGSETRAAQASVGYGNEALGTLSLAATYAESSYDTPDGPLAPGVPAFNSGFRTYGGGLTYGRRIGRRLTGNASLFYSIVDSPVAGGDSKALSGSAALSYTVTQRMTVNLNYVLANSASAVAGTNSVRNESVSLSTQYQLSSRLSASAGVTATRQRSDGVQSTLVQANESENFAVNGGLSYRVGRSISVTLNAAYSERSTSLALFDSNATRVSIAVSRPF